MLYGLYDLPTWLWGLLTIVCFAMASCAGLVLMRVWIRKHLRLSSDINEAINGYFSGVGVIYGLLLGLVAVATWHNFDTASSLISKEAATVASLYRDVSNYPEPLKGELLNHLQNHITY